MAVRFFWRCESATLANSGTDDLWPTSGDNTASASGAPNIGATGVKVGTNGIHTTDGSDFYSFDTNTVQIALPGEGAAGFWVYIVTTMPGFTADIGVAACGDVSSATKSLVTRISGTQFSFQTRDDSGTAQNVTATGTSLAANGWYFCVARWDFANDKLAAEVYTGTNETAIASGENTSATGSPPSELNQTTGLRVGNMSSITSVMYFDNVFIADSYSEPLHLYGNRDITAYSQYSTGASGAKRLLMLGVG